MLTMSFFMQNLYWKYILNLLFLSSCPFLFDKLLNLTDRLISNITYKCYNLYNIFYYIKSKIILLYFKANLINALCV